MSESLEGAPHSGLADHTTAHPPGPAKGSLLLKTGGWLGVLASSISVLIFLIGCFGKDALFARFGLPSVFGLAVAPLLMSVPGLLLSIAGGARRGVTTIDPNVLAALFVNLLGLSGALVEIAVWRQWGLFPAAGGGA